MKSEPTLIRDVYEEAVYNFADEIINFIPKLHAGFYRNDGKILNFELCDELSFARDYPKQEYRLLQKTIIRYCLTSKAVQADIRFKDMPKDLQLFFLLWGFAHELMQLPVSQMNIECDHIALSIFNKYGKEKYSIKNAVIELIRFLPASQWNKDRIESIINANKHKKENG